jgi:protein AaeX
MRFEEINLLGVYVAPMSLMLLAAWLITVGLRRIGVRFGLMRHVWHPALFTFAIYMIILSLIVLSIAEWGRYA